MGLDTIELVMALEERFRITISDEQAQSCRTLGDLVELIVGKT